MDALHSRLEEEAAHWRQLQLGATKTEGLVEVCVGCVWGGGGMIGTAGLAPLAGDEAASQCCRTVPVRPAWQGWW